MPGVDAQSSDHSRLIKGRSRWATRTDADKAGEARCSDEPDQSQMLPLHARCIVVVPGLAQPFSTARDRADGPREGVGDGEPVAVCDVCLFAPRCLVLSALLA